MTRTISDAIRTARKARQCRACLDQIRPGERYHDERCADDHHVWSWPHHTECRDCMDELVDIAYDFVVEGFPEGVLAEIEDVDLPAWWIEWRDRRNAEPMEAP